MIDANEERHDMIYLPHEDRGWVKWSDMPVVAPDDGRERRWACSLVQDQRDTRKFERVWLSKEGDSVLIQDFFGNRQLYNAIEIAADSIYDQSRIGRRWYGVIVENGHRYTHLIKCRDPYHAMRVARELFDYSNQDAYRRLREIQKRIFLFDTPDLSARVKYPDEWIAELNAKSV